MRDDMERDDMEDVSNQPPPFADVDLFASDRPLRAALAVNAPGLDTGELACFGRAWGSAAMFEQAQLADQHPPELEDNVARFHPAYHRVMAASMAAGLHNSTWTEKGAPAPDPAEVARAARFYMAAQVENGHLCPITMTRASVAALAAAPSLLAELMPKISARDYDPEFRPWREKSAMTLGMGMTEKQGGTDVRTNTTRAERDAEGYRLTGHKWFMSAPMSDAFLVLAQTRGGLTCFFMPRFEPDGRVNGIRFVQLKNKLGNRSNASAEAEFDAAFAVRVGEEGNGIRTIIRMVQLTRLDCAISSAGIMRAALTRALHYCRHRTVFQRKLLDQPLMRSVLADLALESEAALATVMRLCRSFDRAAGDPLEAARARLLTPAIKYWICKRAPAFVYEAMECLGGNGYVEDHVLARLYREAPVNAIWEGSGNVMALDLLRAGRDAEETRVVLASLAREAGPLPGVTQALARLEGMLGSRDREAQARAIAETVALIAATAALQESADGIAEIFAQTRLQQGGLRMFGAEMRSEHVSPLLDRAVPQ